MSIIFPTNSPVDRLGGESDVETPGPISRALHARLSQKILSRLGPLLQARQFADRVYSNGYFENHYPEADKKLKRILHDKVMADWANANNDDEEEEEGENEPQRRVLGQGLTININLKS